MGATAPAARGGAGRTVEMRRNRATKQKIPHACIDSETQAEGGRGGREEGVKGCIYPHDVHYTTLLTTFAYGKKKKYNGFLGRGCLFGIDYDDERLDQSVSTAVMQCTFRISLFFFFLIFTSSPRRYPI